VKSRRPDGAGSFDTWDFLKRENLPGGRIYRYGGFGTGFWHVQGRAVGHIPRGRRPMQGVWLGPRRFYNFGGQKRGGKTGKLDGFIVKQDDGRAGRR